MFLPPSYYPNSSPAPPREVLGKEPGAQASHFFEMEGDLVAWRECGPIFPQILGGLGPLDKLRLSLEVKSIARERKDGVGLDMASTAATWWRKEARRQLLQFPEGGGKDTPWAGGRSTGKTCTHTPAAPSPTRILTRNLGLHLLWIRASPGAI